jgi:hypothetical protein
MYRSCKNIVRSSFYFKIWSHQRKEKREQQHRSRTNRSWAAILARATTTTSMTIAGNSIEVSGNDTADTGQISVAVRAIKMSLFLAFFRYSHSHFKTITVE